MTIAPSIGSTTLKYGDVERVDRCRDGVARPGEGKEEAVALGPDLRSVVGRKGRPDQRPMAIEEGFPARAGQRLGVAFAAPFEVVPMGWGE